MTPRIVYHRGFRIEVRRSGDAVVFMGRVSERLVGIYDSYNEALETIDTNLDEENPFGMFGEQGYDIDEHRDNKIELLTVMITDLTRRVQELEANQ